MVHGRILLLGSYVFGTDPGIALWEKVVYKRPEHSEVFDGLINCWKSTGFTTNAFTPRYSSGRDSFSSLKSEQRLNCPKNGSI